LTLCFINYIVQPMYQKGGYNAQGGRLTKDAKIANQGT